MVRITEQLIRKKSEHNELIIGTLEELSLHQEDIEKIEHLQNWCRNLKILLLQNNLIPKIENIFKLKNLEYLNLAVNNIERIENLEELESLEKLDLTLNFIGILTSVDCLKHNYNLKHLTLTGNPCTDFEGYRDYVIVTLPQLENLDGIEIKRSDRILAGKNFDRKRAKIIQLQTEYCIRRDEQKIRINEQRELEALENAQLNEEEIDEKFWKRKSEHCPESRIEISNQQRKAKKSSDKKQKSDEPKRVRKLFADCGRPFNINEARISFRMIDERDRYELNVEVYRFLDTSLVHVDVESNYVRVTIKGKIFQVALRDEIQIEKSSSQRSMTTGHLLIIMPKVNYKAPIQTDKRRDAIQLDVLNTIPKSSFKDNHRPNIIRHNLAIYSKLNDVASIFNELLNLWSYDRPKHPLSNSEKLIIKIAQRKISEGDISGAVRVLSSDDRIADHTQENIDKLERKHPDENLDLEKENIPNLEPFDTSTEQVVNAIKHFPISSSGGIDGMRPRHLKDLISFSCGDASRLLTSAIAKLINIIRSGEIFADIEHIFYGASLIALAKDNGDIRPIAIGLVWRSLAGKIGCFAAKDSVAQLLAPISNGFGVQGGSEAIVHAVRAFAKANHASPTAVIKFDFSNAFNELFRKFLLSEIKTTAPSLFPMMQQAYRQPSSLFFGDAIILSKRGTQQGDPCAPAVFSLALRPLTHSLKSKLNSWFLDDGTIGDVFNVLLEDIRRVLAFSTESGLSLNPAKCEVYFINAPPEVKENMLSELNLLLPGIKELDNRSFRLLGAPILEEGISESLLKGLDTVKTLCKRLPLLDIHPALTLLRSSLASPRFQYLLRTAPTFSHVTELTEIDEFYRLTLEEITNNKLCDTSWIQGSLPMAFAGLGIRRSVDLAHPAYFSSVFQSEDLSNRILAQSNLTIIDSDFSSSIQAYPIELIPPNAESKRIQSQWDNLRSKSTFDGLLSLSGPTDRARLLSSSTQPSSKWLQAVPSQNLGLLLDNDSARVAVALRLGIDVCERHRCICGEMVDSKGYHALSCNKTSGKYVRHSTINKTFSMAFNSAQVPNRLEPFGLSRRDGKRPDGITSYPWSRGRLLIWDVTVVNTMAAKYLRSSSLSSGAAADEAERHKHNLYIDLKDRYIFTPLAFEAFGAIGPETSIFLKKLGKLMKEQTGEKRSLDYLLQRISIAIQRGNAVSIRDSFGSNGGNDLNVFK